MDSPSTGAGSGSPGSWSSRRVRPGRTIRTRRTGCAAHIHPNTNHNSQYLLFRASCISRSISWRCGGAGPFKAVFVWTSDHRMSALSQFGHILSGLSGWLHMLLHRLRMYCVTCSAQAPLRRVRLPAAHVADIHYVRFDMLPFKAPFIPVRDRTCDSAGPFRARPGRTVHSCHDTFVVQPVHLLGRVL